MPPSATCVKCGSTDVVPKVRAIVPTYQFGDYDLRVRVDADPNAIMFKGTEWSPLQATVCGRCGYTDFYAADAGFLFKAWRRSQESSKG